jgi:hypothetical protein
MIRAVILLTWVMCFILCVAHNNAIAAPLPEFHAIAVSGEQISGGQLIAGAKCVVVSFW